MNIEFSRCATMSQISLITAECKAITGSASFRAIHEDDHRSELHKAVLAQAWSLSSEFMSYSLMLPQYVFDAIGNTEKGESCNEAILAMIKGSIGEDEFVGDAITYYSEAKFLNHYDGCQYFISDEGVTWYIYPSG